MPYARRGTRPPSTGLTGTVARASTLNPAGAVLLGGNPVWQSNIRNPHPKRPLESANSQ